MFDHVGLSIAKRICSKKNEYKRYKLVERLFIVFPFMHSEDIQNCQKSIQYMQQNIDYAE
jgi:uncharacterized protein (DUF924 family)